MTGKRNTLIGRRSELRVFAPATSGCSRPERCLRERSCRTP